MNPGTKKLLTTIGAILVALVVWWLEQGKTPQGDPSGPNRGSPQRDSAATGSRAEDAPLAEANRALIAAWKAGLERKWVTGRGRVLRTLRDDDDPQGGRHQKFVLGVADELEVLVAHNIDVAERVPVRRGTVVTFHGRYEHEPATARHPHHGGVLHWTHRDRGGRHAGGWLKVDGKTYR